MSEKTYHGKPCKNCGGTEKYIRNNICAPCNRKRANEYQKQNREHTKHYNRLWRARNREKERERAKRYRAKNPEKVRESQRKYANSNRDMLKKKGSEWSKKNKEKTRVYWHQRRTRKLNASGEFTTAEFKALCHQYGNRCLCCGKSDIRLTADHVIPLSKGGSNDIDNIQPLCSSCNSSKGNYHSTDYRPESKYWEQLKFLE